MKSLKDINKTGYSRLIISLIGLLFTLSLVSPSNAQVNRTPDSKRILVISPATFHQGRHFDWMMGRCMSQQYSIADSAIYSQDSLPRLSPTVTCSTYIKAMTEGDWGVLIFQSHGSASGIGAEFYEDTDSGETARDAAYQRYLDSNIPDSFIYKGHTDSAGFSIGITAAGIRHFQDQVSGTIVFALACHSAGLNDDWGALTALGYNDVITLPAGADTFFQRMNGEEGIEKRNVGDAIQNIPHLLYYNQGDVVLAPVITDYKPKYLSRYTSGDSGRIVFDCQMNTSIPASQVISDSCENAHIVDAHWVGNNILEFYVDTVYNINSRVKFVVWSEKAKSYHNDALLDGNQKPSKINGKGPAGDNFAWDACSPDFFYYNFEDGYHGYHVQTPLARPGIYFHYPWLYTHPGWSPLYDENYYVDGFLGAWPGPDTNLGRFDCIGSTAIRATVHYSSGEVVVLQARASDGSLLDQVIGPVNYGTRRLAQVTVEGDSIAYCLMYTQHNHYFVIDNIVVWDLFGFTRMMVPENYEILQNDMLLISQGQQHNHYIELPDVPHAFNILLNWGEGEFSLTLTDPDSQVYGSWQSSSSPIEVNIPYADSGVWGAVVRAVNVPSQSAYAVIASGMPFPLVASAEMEPSTWYSYWAQNQNIPPVKGIIHGLPPGYSLDSIDAQTILLNGSVPDNDGELDRYPSWPGIVGAVAVAEFEADLAVQSLGPNPLIGFHTCTISGEFSNSATFEAEAEIKYVVADEMPDMAREGVELIPKKFFLSQNYPNPFNPITRIEYGLPRDCRVELTVYNLLGRKVVTLVDDNQTAGYKSFQWNATQYASGIYFYKLTAGDKVFTRRMTLLK